MSRIFSTSVFSSVFKENDYFVENWTMNVFNKIKKSQLLPLYINRDKEMDFLDLLHSNPNVYSDNENTSFGNGLLLNGTGFLNSLEFNLGKTFEINFECKLNSTISGTSFLKMKDIFKIYENTDILINFKGDEFIFSDTETVFVKIIRFHNSWVLKLNDIIKSSVTDSIDIDTILDKVIEYENIENGLISNIKILSYENDKIIHWWKLNCDFEGVFIDIGRNDYDFYSLFSSIIKLFAFIIRFSHFFKFTSDNTEFMKRFLDSKNIFYPINSDNQTLEYLVMNWKNSFNERATQQIYKKKDIVKNYSISGKDGFNLSGVLTQEINIGKDYKIEFLIDLSESTMSYSFLNDTVIITKSVNDIEVTFDLIDSFGELHLLSDIELVDGEHKFQIIKNLENIHLYVDDILRECTITLTPLSPSLSFSKVFDYLTLGNFIDYLSIKKIDTSSPFIDETLEELRYDFNISDSMFIPDVTRNPLYEIRLVGLDNIPDHLLSVLFAKEHFEILDNNSYKEVDGELIRLYDKKEESELIFVKTGFFDLSWIIDKVSPLSYQTYPITMFNKLENKLPTITSLSDYPLRSMRESLDIDVLDCFIDDKKIKVSYIDSIYRDLLLSEVSLTNASYKKEWIVPCMGEKSYEVSFRMEVTTIDPDFNIKFGLIGNGLKDVKTGLDSNLFMNDYNIVNPGYYWIRGVIFGNLEELTDVELGLSVDRENTNHLQFSNSVLDDKFSIKLSFKNNSISSPTILIHDFQFRLLSIPTTRVSLGSKNTAFVYGRNNSLHSDEELLANTKELIPYNMNIKQL